MCVCVCAAEGEKFETIEFLRREMIVRLASFLALLSGCMLGVAAHRQQGHLQPHSMLALRAQIDVQCCPKKCGCSKDIPPLAPEYRDGGTDSHGKPLKGRNISYSLFIIRSGKTHLQAQAFYNRVF